MTNHQLHMMLWGELAITGSWSKSSTMVVMQHHPPNQCFACVEAGYVEDDDAPYMDITAECCPKCPIDWHVEPIEGRCTCEISGSPFKYWQTADNEFMRKKIAEIIRDMRWNGNERV